MSASAQERSNVDTPGPLARALVWHGWPWDSRLVWARDVRPEPREADTEVVPSVEADAWRTLIDPDGAGTFARRLAWAGLDHRRVERLLHDPDTPSHTEHAWMPALERLRAACRSFTEHALPPHAALDPLVWLATVERAWCEDPASADRNRATPFAHLLWPMVQAEWVALEALSADANVTARARDDLRLLLLERLATLFAAALHAACSRDRRPGVQLMLELGVMPDAGASPPVEYATFCRSSLGDGLTALLTEFPVMGRLLATACQQWSAHCAELLARLRCDRPAMAVRFGFAADAPLDRCVGVQSDPHHGGRTVVILTFAARSPDQRVPGVRVVYKPKDLRLEQAAHEMVAEVCAELPGPSPLDVRIMVGDGYGYVAFVDHVPCTSPEELVAFYRQAGRLLAVLHVLGATDCHFENLIAHRHTLVLIDAETLFDGAVYRFDTDDDTRRETAGDGADDPLADSVLRTMLLPCWRGVDQQVQDVSALGVRMPPAVARTLGWRYINTDDMVWAFASAQQPPLPSLPVPGGVLSPYAAHVDRLEQGFEEAYCAMMKPVLATRLAERMRALVGVPRRLVVRNTSTYRDLQRDALSADALRDARVRGRILDQLLRSTIVAEHQPPQWAVNQAEVRDMEQLDVPYFGYPLGSMEVTGGGQHLAALLADDGLAAAVARLQSLSLDDLVWQRRLIRASVYAGAATVHGMPSAMPSAMPSQPQTDGAALDRVAPSHRDAAVGHIDMRAVAAAGAAIRTQIVSSAVRSPGGHDATWLVLSVVPGASVLQLRSASVGLYDGIAGIVAWLMAASVGEDSLAVLAQTAAAPLWRLAQQDASYRQQRQARSLGMGLTGLGGVLRLFEILARTPAAAGHDWRGAAESLADALTDEVVASDRRLDVMAGVAGIIGPLARLHRDHPRAGSAEVLRRTAMHLLHAQDSAYGTWTVPVCPRPLTGLSHGASGMGLALLEAAVALGDEGMLDAGARAFAFEASVFDPATGNWPDFRTGAPAGSCFTTWCHGAPGIALARVRALQLAPGHADAAQWRLDVTAAADAIIAHPLGPIDQLCCGNLGRATILQLLGEWALEPRWLAAAEAIMSAVVARAARDGEYAWGLGVGVESPGLMTGVAGIGLSLLARTDRRVRRDLFTLLV